MLRVLGWVVWKELRLFAADRNGAILTVVTPVVLGALLGALFAPPDKAREMGLLVVAPAQGERVQKLVAALDASDSLKVERVDEATARARLKKGDANVALLLPADAEARLAPEAMFGSQRLALQVLHDPSAAVEAGLAEGLVTQVVMGEVFAAFNDPAALRRMLGSARDTIRAAKLAGVYDGPVGLAEVLDDGVAVVDRQLAEKKPGERGSTGMVMPVTVDRSEVTAAGPTVGYNSFAHNFAGMLCMFILFAGVDRAKNLAAERDGGTLQRLRMAPVHRNLLLVGSGLATVVIGLAISAAVYGAAMLFFGVRILGSVPGFALVLLAQAVFVAGFSLLLTGIGRTETQIANLGTVPILVMSFLGGATIPTFVLPGWVQTVSAAVPTYWATRGLAAMTWRGLPFGDALLPAAALLGMGVVLASVGIRRFRWD